VVKIVLGPSVVVCRLIFKETSAPKNIPNGKNVLGVLLLGCLYVYVVWFHTMVVSWCRATYLQRRIRLQSSRRVFFFTFLPRLVRFLLGESILTILTTAACRFVFFSTKQ
jgi:hypothetical protein